MICSFGDWRKNRMGDTKNPPGKPEGLQSIAMKNKLVVEKISIPII